MNEIQSVKTPDFLSGGGEMGERIRNFDWSKTSLGVPEHWEQSLKTCVRIMLSSPQPIWIGWGKELIKLYNDAYIDIVRGKHPLALGQPASVVWKDIWKDIEPLLVKAIEKDEGTYVESQLLIMERSGYPEETYYTFSYTPVLGDSGKPAGMICYNTADAERIINERSLKTLQELDTLAQKKNELEVYEQTVKALETNKKDFPFAIISKVEEDGSFAERVAFAGFSEPHPDIEQRIDLTNPGFGAKNVATAVMENRIVESYNDGRWKNLPKGAWDIMPHSYVHIPVKSANRKFPLAVLSIGLNPYRQFDDVYRNFVQLVADQISLGVNNAVAYEEERKRREALQEIDRAKTIFFSNISHEFRTPLTLMLGTLEEAINDKDTRPKNVQRMNVTHRNAMRLLKLVNTLLDFSRLESGRQKANYVLTDIGQFTENLAGNFRSIIEKAGLEFIVEADKISQPVYVDKSMWEKILFNLLSNAFKYTLEGSVRVRLFSRDNLVTLEVHDSGIGIPEKELPLMFERFHRVENNAGRTYEGTGIGLSFIKELVQLHGGSIAVESREGVGSVFTVIIPAGKEHLPADQISELDRQLEDGMYNAYVAEASSLLESAELSDENEVSTAEKITILVVDDNADMRQHIQAVLKQYFHVVTAGNGLEALEVIKSANPTLVISDIMMPVMDGIELLRELKQDKQSAQLPVILLTARAGEESKVEGFETGADDYLVKPFSANELLSRVKAQITITQKRSKIEDRLKSFLMQAPAALAILEGPKHLITLANAEFEKMLGRTANQLIGHTVREAFPELQGQGFVEVFDDIYRTGEPFIAHASPAVIMKDGVPTISYYDYIMQPIKNDSGNIIELMGFGVDVTAQVEARKKIEASEKQFRNVLLESPSIFVILKGPDMVISFVNQPLLNSWGKNWDILGKPLLQVLPELKGQDFPRLLDEVYETGELYEGREEKAMIIKNGVAVDIFYHYVYQPIFEPDGGVSGITIMANDITDQVMARKKVEASEQQIRSFFMQAPAAIAILEGPEHRYRLANPMYQKLFARTEQELMGHTFKEVYPEMAAQGIYEILHHSYTSGEPFFTREFFAGFLENGKNKTGYYDFVIRPIKDSEGRVNDIMIHAIEITESVLARQKVESSNTMIRNVYMNAPAFVAVFKGPEHVFELVNPSYHALIGHRDVIGKKLVEALPELISHDGLDILNAVYRSGETKIDKERRVSLALYPGVEPETHYINYSFQPVFDEHGNVNGVLAFGNDVTAQVLARRKIENISAELEQKVLERTAELKEKNIALENSNRELESFNYIASHDLQEPLRKIQTFVQLLEKNQENPDTWKKYADKIHESSKRMSQLIQNVLEYSRLLQNESAFQKTDLNEVLENVKSDYELLISEKGATITSERLPTMEVIPLQIHQLFANFISNSLKFSEQTPEIKVSSRIVDAESVPGDADPKKKYIEIKFSDNGIGFEAQYSEQIFKLFQRLHPKSSYSGTGVGLSIVKKIIEQHQGFIRAESGTNKGATFTLWLPLR